MKRFLLTALVALAGLVAHAQVSTTPAFIEKGYKGEIVITFDPTQGNGGMVGATACYAHTGLITEKSTKPSDWKYATKEWRGEEAKYKMTKEGDVWTLTIPNIYTYYGCPETEEILSMAFVFNDGKGGSKEGKAADGKDIYVDLVEKGAFSVKFDAPNGNQLLDKGAECDFAVSATADADIELAINGNVVSTAKGNSLKYTHTFAETGDYVCIAKATADGKSAHDTVTVCVATAAADEARPAGLKDGITYYADDPTRATLSMYAKDINDKIAQNIFVMGDFNNWSYSSEYQMKRDGSTGYFWLDIDGLEPGREYVFQYAVTRADGSKVQVSDPYTEKVIDNDCAWIPADVYPGLQTLPAAAQGPAAVLQTDKPEYEWSDATLNFKRPDKNNLVIYEVWVYDFCPYRSIAGLTKRLDYIENLGVNAIELMPVCEFEGNVSWGYNPTHYFAFDKAYGTPDDFKAFVDECHRRGIAVIMDMVFNHCTGLNPMNRLFPLEDNPFFNVTAPHSYKIFEDFNHEFDVTNRHFTRVLNYWIEEYKIDGYRMDVSHGLCGYDCNNIVGILDGYYKNGVKAVADDAYFILEHWPWEDGRGESERQELVNRGMMCWTNINNAYSQTAMGYIGDNDDLTPANYDGFVTYCGSHDEERNFYKASQWGKDQINKDTTVRLNRIAANVAMNVMLNGPQMIWQFDEIGYDYSINYNSYNNGTIEEDGRTSPKPMPEAIGYLKSPLRMNQYQKLGQMIQLRTRLKPEVFKGNPKWNDISSGKQLRSVGWGEENDMVFVISNLDASTPLTYKLPDDAAQWYDYLADSQTAENAGKELTLNAGEVKVWTASYIKLPEVPDSYNYTDTVLAGTDNVVHPECTVYPTIATDIVYIDSDETPQQIDLVNLSGQRLISQSGHSRQINVASLPRGLYIVVVSFDHRYEAFKIYRK